MLSPSSARGPVVALLDASCSTSLARMPCQISSLSLTVCILRLRSCHTDVYVINRRERAISVLPFRFIDGCTCPEHKVHQRLKTTFTRFIRRSLRPDPTSIT